MKEPKLIIVGGLPRSGSTFLRFLLDSSQTVIAGPETNFFRFPLWQTLDRIEKIVDRLSVKLSIESAALNNAILSSGSSIEAFGNIMQLYAGVNDSNKVVFAEKTPLNCHAYSRLASECDNIFFISTVRHGLDVVTSVIENHPRRTGYWCSVQRYIDDCNAIFSFKHQNHLIWNYEDAMESPAEQAEKVFEFIGEPFSIDYLDRVNQPSATRDLSKVNQPKLGQALSTDWIDRWRLPEHKEKVSEFLSNEKAMYWLKQTGYKVTENEK